MKRVGWGLAVLGAAALVAFFAKARPDSVVPSSPTPTPTTADFTPEEVEKILQHSPLGAPPPDPTNVHADDPAAARLGQILFYDPRFSKDGKVSCSTCHVPTQGFTDGKGLSDRFSLDRNVPTLWNVGYNRWYFWDGRSDSLWSQALKPLENPREQGGSRLQFAHLVVQDSRLKALYEKVFGAIGSLEDATRFPAEGGPLCRPEGGPLHRAWTSMKDGDREAVDRIFANLGKAIAAYERLLQSRRSRFDVFVEGLRQGDASKISSLSAGARKGLKLFVGRGNCRLCHSGPAFTDGEFHNLGIAPARGAPAAGRYAAIADVRGDAFNSKGRFSDNAAEGARKLDDLLLHQDLWGQVKTPSLRNVAKTAPYMSQGQFKTLDDVVDFYSTLQGMLRAGHHERAILSPLTLSAEEHESLVEFLGSLTDEKIDESLLRPPP
jgi:cytochrome c peroxidase